MRFKNKNFIIVIVIVILFVGYFMIRKNSPSLLNEEILKVDPIKLSDNMIIEFPHTDDNTGESIIIKTDKEIYEGGDRSDVYFALTNTGNEAEKVAVLSYFPKEYGDIDYIDVWQANATNDKQPTTNDQNQKPSWQRLLITRGDIKANMTKLEKAFAKKKTVPEEFDVRAGIQFEIPSGHTAYFKAQILYPSDSRGEFWFEAFGDKGGYGLLDPVFVGGTTTSADTKPIWYSESYGYRKKFTIDYRKVAGGSNLTNFPVLISHTDSDIRTTANGGKSASGSGEFVITSSDGKTVLPHEIESYSATTGEIIAWVNVTTLSATQDTSIYMYYGGPSAGGATNQNKTGTWNSNYTNVYHFGNGVTLNLNDSSSGGRTLTNNGAAAGSGKISGAAVVGDSGDDMVTASYQLGSTSVTAEMWVKATTFDQNGQLFFRTGATPATEGWESFFDAAGAGSFYWWGDGQSGMSALSITPLTRNAWNYIVTTISGTTGSVSYNGNTVNIGTVAASGDVSTTLKLGEYTNGSYNFNGSIDEARVSNVVRTTGWIKTQYNNQSSPRTFYTIGGQESRTAQDRKSKRLN